MERKFLAALILMLLFGALALAMDAALQGDAKKEETKAAVPQCLACHGPFDKLAASTADFKTASGETVTPHQYVPHADKKDIPECTECHTPHEVPLKDKASVVKPKDVDWCYSSCHHASNLQPCKTCH